MEVPWYTVDKIKNLLNSFTFTCTHVFTFTCSLHQNLVRKRECQRKGHVGVKFPIFCYKFGGDSRDVGPSDSKGLQQHQQRVVPYITYIINFVTIMTI